MTDKDWGLCQDLNTSNQQVAATYALLMHGVPGFAVQHWLCRTITGGTKASLNGSAPQPQSRACLATHLEVQGVSQLEACISACCVFACVLLHNRTVRYPAAPQTLLSTPALNRVKVDCVCTSFHAAPTNICPPKCCHTRVLDSQDALY